MNGLRMLLCCSLALCVAPLTRAAESPRGSANELAGLWTAKRWNGPFARGTLIIRKTGSGYTADMLGDALPVRIERGELVFELPSRQGTFRGKLQQGSLLGHWYSPNRHATPLTLKPDGRDRWKGQVEPYDDSYTFHLLVREGRGDTLQVLLNNPETNYGNFLGVKRIVREGEVLKLIGKLPWEKSESAVAKGTYDPESQTITLAFPSRGGTYDFQRDDTNSQFYPRGEHPGKYVYQPPLARDDGWPTGTLEEAGVDRPGIERLVQMLIDARVDSASTPRVHALLVVRHGKLVLEEYFHGEHRDKLHDTRSAAKSVTSVVVGAALRGGAPLTLSTPVYQLMSGGSFPPDLDPRKRSMTLEHLLTMSSGYFCDDTNDDAPGNEDKMQEQTDEPDWVRYTLAVPLATAPGEKSVYCSASPNLALAMVERSLGESPLYLFDHAIAAPMQIHRYAWGVDPAEHLYGGGGMKLLPRDFMKFGQLMLNGGTWRGQRILTREFVERASSPLYHLRGLVYGYLWWGIDYPYKERTVHAFFAGGNGGQSVIVIPELDLVIASFGGNYNEGPGTFYMQTTVTPRDLLPCVREPGDDPHAPVVPRKNYKPKIGPREEAGPITTR